MINLNETNWSLFCIGDFFNSDSTMYKSRAYNKNDLVFCDSNDNDAIPYITRTNLNNGTLGYVKKTEFLEIEKSNALIVGDTTTTCFFQDRDFVTGDHIVVLRNEHLNKYNSQFLITCILMHKERFNYAISFKIEQIKKTFVMLPSLVKDDIIVPDWDLMTKYIKDLSVNVKKVLKEKISIIHNVEIESVNYKEFRIKDIFETNATQTNEIGKFQAGTVPFICSSNMNNGIQGFVTPNENTQIEKGNSISVSSLDGTSFYQENDFVGRGHGSVNVLRNKHLNKYNSLYICTCIKKQSEGKFDYNHQLFLTALSNLIIKLPIDENEKPNWNYMEKYIKKGMNIGE